MLRGAISIIFVYFLLVDPSLAAGATDRTALIVANGQYSSWPTLKNPVADAAIVRAGLERSGFKVEVVENASRQQLWAAIKRFSSGAAPTVRLLYFAGHGVQIGRDNFLIPTDVETTDEDELPTEALALSEILTVMGKWRPQTAILVIDACRSSRLTSRQRGAVTVDGLARMQAPPSFYLAFSTEPGKVALDGSGATSPFAQAFAEAVTMPDIEIEAAFREVRRRVWESTGRQQVPRDESALISAFSFAPTPGAAPTAARRGVRHSWTGSREAEFERLSGQIEEMRQEIRRLSDERWKKERDALEGRDREASNPFDSSLREANLKLLNGQNQLALVDPNRSSAKPGGGGPPGRPPVYARNKPDQDSGHALHNRQARQKPPSRNGTAGSGSAGGGGGGGGGVRVPSF